MNIIWKSKDELKDISFELRQGDSEWKRAESGFFLIEILVALFVLSLVLAILIPSWMLINERMEAYQSRQVALIAAQNEMERFVQYLGVSDTESVVIDGQTHTITWELVEQGELEEGSLSITWNSPSNQYEEISFQLFRIKEDTH